MKLDKTKIIFEKWEQLESKKVKILLKSGELKEGIIASFTHGNYSFIEFWILKRENNPFNLLLIDDDEQWIKSNEILEIYFYEDKSTILL